MAAAAAGTAPATPAPKPHTTLTDPPPPASKPDATPPAADAPKPDAPKPDAPVADAPKPDAPTPAAADAATPKPPDTYTLAIPKDAEAWLDATDVTAIEKTAREQGWTNEQAQAALDRTADMLAEQSAAFRAQTESDATYGGANLGETQRLARLALDKVRPAGTPRGDALRRILARSGYGNHLEVVSMLADLGKQFAEDTPIAGSSGAGQKTAAEILYPSMKG